MNRYPDNSASVAEQAAEWLVELAEPGCSEGSRRRFMQWLKKSPQHIEEFLAVAALQQEVAEQSSTVAEITAELSAGKDVGAVALFGNSSPAESAPQPARARRRHYFLWATAACMVLTTIFLLQLLPGEAPGISHRTGVGEQRSVALSDGSIVTLNTKSEAAAHFDSSTRRVTLVEGEAMFDVVQDAARPFVVETGSVSLKVIGTRFSVYRKQNSTRLAVVEGEVSAISRQTPGVPVVVRAGQGAVATAEGIALTDPQFDVEKAIAWTERRLIFDGATLAEVVAEFNRYNRVPLVVEDSALASRAITSVFHAHDVSALVGFLELEPDVEVERGDDAIRIHVKR